MGGVRRQKAEKLGRRGQSILEYLIIVTVIIVAVLVAKGAFSTNMTTLLATANQKVPDANTALGGQAVESIP